MEELEFSITEVSTFSFNPFDLTIRINSLDELATLIGVLNTSDSKIKQNFKEIDDEYKFTPSNFMTLFSKLVKIWNKYN